MNTLARNFFYAVGATLLLYMYSLNPTTASFADLVRLVQSETARNIVLLLTIVFWALDFATGIGDAICISIPVPRREKEAEAVGNLRAKPETPQA